MRLPAVRGPLHAAGRKGGAGASSESRFMEILSHRQVSDNSGECFVSGMKLLRRHLTPSSPSPALSSVASLGCFTPTRRASPPGLRHSRAVSSSGWQSGACVHCNETAGSPANGLGGSCWCCLWLTVLYELFFNLPP